MISKKEHLVTGGIDAFAFCVQWYLSLSMLLFSTLANENVLPVKPGVRIEER